MMAIAGVGSYFYYGGALPSPPNGGQPQPGKCHLFQMSAADVEAYGFYYPVTFTFSIPSGSASLKALYHYVSTDWSQLPERQSKDFFNGEDVVRFDYAGNRAYVSVGFKGQTDLYIKITDSQSLDIETAYFQVAKYYDNRHCAVTSHHDDYGIGGGHLALIEEFQKRKLWYGCAVVTSSPDWASLQTQVNEGYVEVESHSVNHPYINKLSDSEAWNQIQGSRDAILSHINNMPYGQYVLAFIFPYSSMGDRERNYVGKANYIVEEADVALAGTDPSVQQYETWYVVTYNGESHGVFPAIFSADMGTHGGANSLDLNWLNSQFDQAYSAEAIYEVRTHPTTVDIGASYCQGHLNYISGRTDCWYAPLGHIYAYHYVALFVQHSEVS